jgi:Mannosyltransferase (PIG-V)
MTGPAPSSTLPRWARIVDVLCFLLIVVAAIVAFSGGFRLRAGGLRLALTSPFRLIVWAAVLSVVRHALVRQPSAFRFLGSLFAALDTVPLRTAAIVALGTRPAIFFVGYVSIFAFGYATGVRPPVRFFENELLNMPVRHDAGWYLQIAIYGYQYLGQLTTETQQNLVFFPAFPLLMRWLALVGGNTWLAHIVSGTIISLAAFVAALAYLYALARDYLDEAQARTALWMLAAYPFALFYGALYTESLFLLTAVGSIYHFRRREWWRAAAWACLAGLTRPNGFLLGAALGTLAITPWLPAWLAGGTLERSPRTSAQRDRGWTLSAAAPGLLVASAAGVGVLLYSAYVWSMTGDPLTWLKLHAAWGRRYTGLWFIVGARYAFITEQGWHLYMSNLHHDLLNGLGVIFVLASAWPVARRFGLAYSVFILINILPPIASGELLSAGRFSAVLFPAFLWLAQVVPSESRAGWIASFAAVQGLNAAMFYTWRQLF